MVDLLTMASQHQNTVLDAEHERSMLEGALTFLVILLSLRLHLGKTDDHCTFYLFMFNSRNIHLVI